MSDIISKEGILPYLKKDYKDIPIYVYKSITSTNTEAKKLSLKNFTHGTIIISEEQTEGRGRFGRSFFSPPHTGIYMSIILDPNLISKDSTTLITPAAAVAVTLAIDKYSNIKPKIKWVNDIFMREKKICGILTEAVTDFENGMIKSIVVGIGINVKTKNNIFPNELKDIAGSIFESEEINFTRNQLIGEIINIFLTLCENLKERKFLKTYKERSLILGKNILFYKNNQWLEGYASDIGNNGELIVIQKDGTELSLQSGEISIKK